MYDWSADAAMMPSKLAALTSFLADRNWVQADRLAKEIMCHAEAIQGYAQSKMEQPVLLLGPERG